jgi:DNA adenine methylase
MGQLALNLNSRISARPVLKWAGGKGQLLPQINDRLPNMRDINRYIEPFVGGGALFFNLSSKYDFDEVFLFDVNPELVILYNVIKNNVDDLIAELAKINKEYCESGTKNGYYIERRNEYNDFPKRINANMFLSDFIRRAALTIFLNHTCFNGLFRVNAAGKFNVPVGKYANPKILDVDNLLAASSALQNATIEQTDFANALKYADNKTFIYYDPPYRPIKQTSNFNSYAVNSFGDDEQKRLKDIFVMCDAIGAKQMLSNSDPTNYANDQFFDELYSGFNINRVMAKRVINSNADGRNEIRELLITNY